MHANSNWSWKEAGVKPCCTQLRKIKVTVHLIRSVQIFSATVDYSNYVPPQMKCHRILFFKRDKAIICLQLVRLCRLRTKGQRESERVLMRFSFFNFHQQMLKMKFCYVSLSVYQLIRILFVMGATRRSPQQPKQIPSGGKRFVMNTR